MMLIFSFLFQKIKRISLAIIGLFSLFLLGRNSRLSKQNKTLSSDLQGQSQIIDIQKKVIDVTKNNKHTELNGTIQRMRRYKFSDLMVNITKGVQLSDKAKPMKYLKLILSTLLKEQSYLRSVFVVIILTRLMFLEDNQLALIAEIVSGLVVIFTTSPTAIDD